MKSPTFAAALIFGAALMTTPALGAPCAPSTAPSPLATVQGLYAAAMRGDRAGMLGAFGPGFYAFYAGKRYSASELAGLAQTLEANHKAYTWSITDADVHVGCDVAWVAYVNRGTMTGQAGTHQLSWLESAILSWQDGAWKLVFFQSERGPGGTR